MSKKSDSWLKLVQVIANVEVELGKVLQAKHGLGLSEYRALDILTRSPNSEMRMQELATYLSLNQSSVSRMVERLHRGGFAVRDVCPDDKRGVYTVLTDKGRAQVEGARLDYEKTLSAALQSNDCAKLLSVKFAQAE